MTRHPALHRQPLRTGVVLLALLGAGTATAPAAWAVVDQGSPSADQSASDAPVTLGGGELRLFVGEEQGNELGGDVDLGGATIRVTFTGPEDDGEDYTCTTDVIGRCVFTDDEGEFSLGTVPGDELTVEQLTAPSSGVFTLPSPEDAVLRAVVPTDSQGIPADRVTPVEATASPGAGSTDLVDRMAPDVLSKHGTWDQIVFFDPLATAPGGTEPGTTDPDGSAPAGGAPGAVVPGAVVPDPAVPGTSTSAASAPAVTTSAGASATPATTTPAGASTPAAPTVDDRSLATTGDELGPVLLLGGALLAAGTAGLLAARRRAVR